MRSWLFMVGFMVLISCSIDYGEQLVETLENIPNSILEDFEQVTVRDNKPIYKLSAELIESYNAKALDRLQEVSVFEFDETGEVLTSGSASRAEVYQRTRDGTFFDVSAYSKQHKTQITASDLQWNDQLRQLRSTSQGTVNIKRDNGLSLQGRGFFADFKNALLRFDADISGVYDEDKSNEKSQP